MPCAAILNAPATGCNIGRSINVRRLVWRPTMGPADEVPEIITSSPSLISPSRQGEKHRPQFVPADLPGHASRGQPDHHSRPTNGGMIGGFGDDCIFALTGADLFFANESNDRMYTGEGNKTVFGGQGKDIVLSGSRRDTIQGNEGNDTVHATSLPECFERGRRWTHGTVALDHPQTLASPLIRPRGRPGPTRPAPVAGTLSVRWPL